MKPSETVRNRLSGPLGLGFVLSDGERDALESELDDILRLIASKASMSAAEKDLDSLGQLQELLALLRFRYDAELTKRQREIVRQFDRSDDFGVRLHVFKQIKAGKL
jgi:hypothetical protein